MQIILQLSEMHFYSIGFFNQVDAVEMKPESYPGGKKNTVRAEPSLNLYFT